MHEIIPPDAPKLPKPKGGRPRKGQPKKVSEFVEALRQPDVVDYVMKLVATGATWKQIGRHLNANPATIKMHLLSDDALMERYIRAKEACTHFIIDEVQEMASDMMEEMKVRQVRNKLTGEIETRGPDLERMKVMAAVGRTALAAKLAAAEKLNPKRFGPLLKLGGDSDNPFQVVVKDYSTAARIEGPPPMKDVTPKNG